ncbi:hypothetical protein MNV49_006368 [Pseudohyphozyma bogoriensis]|nr:hypothetical protein MNV49_006368 [Pseudohyphozyma bogoriensis]
MVSLSIKRHARKPPIISSPLPIASSPVPIPTTAPTLPYPIPLPTLSFTPASPESSTEEFDHVANPPPSTPLVDEDPPPRLQRHQEDDGERYGPTLEWKSEKLDFTSPYPDDISRASSSSTRRNRGCCISRTSSTSSNPASRGKFWVLRMLIVGVLLGLGIGLGVGFSKPNQAVHYTSDGLPVAMPSIPGSARGARTMGMGMGGRTGGTGAKLDGSDADRATRRGKESAKASSSAVPKKKQRPSGKSNGEGMVVIHSRKKRKEMEARRRSGSRDWSLDSSQDWER